MNRRRLIGTTCGIVLLCAATAFAAAAGNVRQVRVVADRAPDCSSLKSIVESVTRGCTTNDEKAVAIYNFFRMVNYHRQYPSEPGGIPALKLINVYGWSLCGGQHTALAALWREAGWEWRYRGWSNPGHTTVEAKYDGQWHYLDTFLKFYVWKQDANAPGGRTIAGQEDIKTDPALITAGLVLDNERKVYYHKGNRFELVNEQANWTAPAFLVCGDEPKGVITGVNSSRVSGSPTGWAGITFDGDYSTDVNLAPGESLTLLWDAIKDAYWWNGRKDVPGHTCGDKDYRNCPAIGPVLEPYAALNARGARSFASGRLVFAPDFKSDAFLSALAAIDNAKLDNARLVPVDPARPASVTVALQSPYVMSRASGEADGAEKAELSTDGGKTFAAVELKDFSDAVGGKYRCLVKLSFKDALKALRLEVIVQHNRCALPYLSPGKNKITVSVADAKELGDNRLALTYAYALGSRDRSYEDMVARGAELARAHYAAWSETPTVVQKTFAAKDLPATFEIDVPTPKDKFPVYPRMLFLRREVLAPGAKPMSLPEGAAEPKTGPNDALKTLPCPFLMGIALPPKPIARATTSKEIPLAWGHVVAKDGKMFDDHFIKWQKDDSAAWVMLVGGEVKDLPKPGEIASAALCFPVTNSIPQAPTQVGCVLLAAPFEKDKPYDFKNLGEILGTVNVPKQAGPGEPKYFKIDVTRGIKKIAGGEAPFHGFAIRTIPNRGVDDGWTTRIDLAKDQKTYLELSVYSGK